MISISCHMATYFDFIHATFVVKYKNDVMNLENNSVFKQFVRILIPTLIGMFFSSFFVVVDGIMIGRGVGADALAAVNIVSPLFTLSTGIGLMFGVGGSVLASIALGANKVKRANMYAGYSTLLSTVIAMLVIITLYCFPEKVASVFGTPPIMMDNVLEYLFPLAPTIFFNVLMTAGLFFIRLDGSPNFAMICVASGALINILLDYIFIFYFEWGLFGAAFATMLSQLISCLLVVIYLIKYALVIRITTFKISKKTIYSVLRSSVSISSLGFSAFLGDLAISLMVVIGNMTFIHYLGVDGVAAFSVVCFLFPIIFMAYNAIIQSAQPIISFNYNKANTKSKQVAILALKTTMISGLLFMVITLLTSKELVSLFLSVDTKAYDIAINGIGWFSIGFFFFGLNLLAVGYMQSIGKAKEATSFTIFRSMILMLFFFFLLPFYFGNIGIWLAVPAAEILAFIVILVTTIPSINRLKYINKLNINLKTSI